MSISVSPCVNATGEDSKGGYSDSDKDVLNSENLPDDEPNEAQLTPLERILTLTNSGNAFQRQEAAKLLHDTLLLVQKSADDPVGESEVFSCLLRLSDDKDYAVKTELVEQLAYLAPLCLDPSYFEKYILAIVLKTLVDENTQVRKSSQSALMQLLESKMLSHELLTNKVCPLLLELTDPNGLDELRMESVGLIARIGPYAGHSAHVFLDTFATLCKDSTFTVRKVCAAHFGAMCSVLGNEATTTLLPQFSSLCYDNVWGVRKACAECFMTVSLCSSLEQRREFLTPLFVSLLKDQSRWVRMAAFQQLGPFISTFADVSKSGLSLSDDGHVIVKSEPIPSPPLQEEINNEFSNFMFWREPVIKDGICLDEDLTEESSTDAHESVSDHYVENNSTGLFTEPEELDREIDFVEHNRDEICQSERDEENHCNGAEDSFKPTSLLEQCDSLIDSDLVHTYDTSGPENVEKHDDDIPIVPPRSIPYVHTDSSVGKSSLRMVMVDDLHHSLGERVADSSLENSLDLESNESIFEPNTSSTHVPSPLLQQFISMTDQSRAQTVDLEIAKFCAFSLPAVAFTLGRDNWKIISKTYHQLAENMQWKVRRTLAFSIHELAVILGPVITEHELVKVFDSFLKDLDEVKIGVLKHFSDFLKLLKLETRRTYLPKLSDFVKSDNVRNWRFRQDLADQFTLLCDFFDASDIRDFICPLAISLSSDRVAEVRQASYRLLTAILNVFFNANDPSFVTFFVRTLISRYAHSTTFFGRLTFAQMCCNLSSQVTVFQRDLLPELLALHCDPVVNVRVVAARTLAYIDKVDPSLLSRDSSEVTRALDALAADTDRDVVYYCHSLIQNKNSSELVV